MAKIERYYRMEKGFTEKKSYQNVPIPNLVTPALRIYGWGLGIAFLLYVGEMLSVRNWTYAFVYECNVSVCMRVTFV